ncbi:hypothetical protein C8Q76DRAFT_702902 [Earliella scabrosa]|nr:hypothetical protein C8Q76DRAFT_702902 [Earliella scabrosa]
MTLAPFAPASCAWLQPMILYALVHAPVSLSSGDSSSSCPDVSHLLTYLTTCTSMPIVVQYWPAWEVTVAGPQAPVGR